MLKNQIKLIQKHDFWDGQPVQNPLEQGPAKDGPFEHKKVEDVQKEPYALPNGFEWYEVDINDDDQAQQLYDMLKNHYVEDSEGNFRFEYPIPLLKWVLCVPNFKKEWHIGIRASKDKKMLAFISGTPLKVVVNG